MDGANGCHWSLYVLHAEMDDLLWDMSSLSEKRIFLIRFKMDYENLLKVTKEIYQIGSFQKKKNLPDWTFYVEIRSLCYHREQFADLA